ncbi:MAG: IS21 family transposase [Sphingobacteriales bacterium]
MSNKLVTMQQVRLVIHHLIRKASQREISREMGISRNTVSSYVSRLSGAGFTLQELQEMDDSGLAGIVYPSLQEQNLDKRKIDITNRLPYLLSELGRTGVTRLLLWKEYKKEVPAGYEYPQFCTVLACEKKMSGASMHFEYQPGDLLLVDFAGDLLSYIDKDSGEVITCPVLVCVLPFSGYSYVRALANATLPLLINALNECLAFMGGVPMNFKSDNMKQIVYKSCRYEPVFTEMIQQWALHNQITLQAARVRKPKDKAPVESEVRLAYQRIYAPLRNKQFYSLSELNRAISEQLREHHQMPFQKRAQNRYTRFMQEEQLCLQALPAAEFSIKHTAAAKVQKNYHIILGEDWHQYSVPFSYIGKTVQLIYDTDTVEIFLKHQRIALHVRNYKKHGYTTCAEHMPESHQRYLEQKGWDKDYFLKQTGKIGTATHEYISLVLESKRFTEQTYNACLGLLRLAKNYGNERMEAACRRGLRGRTFNYRAIHNILMTGIDKLEEDPQTSLFVVPAHDNLRGREAFE